MDGILFCSSIFSPEYVISYHMNTTILVQNIVDVYINAKYIGCFMGVTRIHLMQILVDQEFLKKGPFQKQFSEIRVYFGF